MDICEELLHAESGALERREKVPVFDAYALSEKLLALNEVDALAAAAPIAMRLCRQFHA